MIVMSVLGRTLNYPPEIQCLQLQSCLVSRGVLESRCDGIGVKETASALSLQCLWTRIASCFKATWAVNNDLVYSIAPPLRLA